MGSDQVTGLGVEEVLDAVEAWHATQTEAEVAIFVAAARFADLHHPDTRDAGGPVLAGMERPRRLGGSGTPLVWEFAVAEFGARLGKSPYAGRGLIADALDTRHRLPRLWARVCAGEVPVSRTRYVAQQTRELSAEAAATVDAAIATYADGRLNWTRFQTLVAAKVTEADPQAERERQAAEEAFAKVGRSNEHGQKTLYVKSPAAAIVRINATIDFYARILAVLGDTDTLDHRRAKAVLILANPLQALQLLQTFATHRSQGGTTSDAWPAEADDAQPVLDDTGDTDATEDSRDGGSGVPAAFTRPFRPHEIRLQEGFRLGFDPRKLLPKVTVYLHLYARTDTGHVGPVARWEGEGPITTAYVRDLLGPHCEFTIKPVIDLAGQAPVDGYEIPDAHREAVHLRTPADVFPYAANTTRRMQLDHTRPYVPRDHGGGPGQTHPDNLGPMTGFHHRVKTHGNWQVKQPFPGIHLWRDPHGRIYLVDHTGTRRLATTGPPDPVPGPIADLTVDVYPADPGDDLTYAVTHAA